MVCRFSFYLSRPGEKKRVARDIVTNGWFYINPLLSLNSPKFTKYKKLYPEIFRIEHSVTRYVYLSYLSTNEYLEFKSNDDFDIDNYKSPDFHEFKYSETDYYRIRAYDEWKTEYNCTRLRYESFECYLHTKESVDSVRDDPMVQYVEPFHGFRYHARYSVGYLDSGAESLSYDGKLLQTKRSLYEHGLTGEDQVISITDNGCDTNHSFFYDESVPVVFGETMENHRKIIKYEISSENEGIREHGTFVAGLAAGKPDHFNESDNSLYSGVALDSKLHIIENAGNSIPYFGTAVDSMKNVGSHILTSSLVMNQLQAQYTDDVQNFAYNNPDMLFIFPSGNDNFQVYAPADATNALTVGSSNRPYIANVENSRNVTFSCNDTVFRLREYSKSLFDKTTKLIDLQNIEISLDDDPNTIYITDECINESLQALAVVFPNSTDLNSCPNLENTTVLICNDDDFDNITDLDAVNISFTTDEVYELQPSSFSSPGPSQWGCKKPDIMAPGENIMSARVGTNDTTIDSIITLSGTSAAASQISGFAALITQYFNEGFYPSLRPNESDRRNVSSALVKAILVNCAKNTTERPVRTAKGGFGVPVIKDGIGFGKFGVRFVDKEKIYPRQHIIYEFSTDRKSDFSITLNYIDFPTPTQHYTVLHADLNLVIEANNNTYLGNMNPRGFEEELTPVEKVILKDLDPQKITIHIYSNNFNPDANIEYCIAIMGGFETKDDEIKLIRLEDNNKCPGNCSGYSCGEEGWCDCPYNIRGMYCQTQMKQLDTTPWNGKNVYRATADEVVWYYLFIPQYNEISLQFSTRWHTQNVREWINVVGDSKYGAADCWFRFIIPSEPQYENAVYSTEFMDFPSNTTLYFGIYLTYGGEQEGLIGSTMQWFPTPEPTPMPTPTPDPTATPLPTQTFAPTPESTPSITPS